MMNVHKEAFGLPFFFSGCREAPKVMTRLTALIRFLALWLVTPAGTAGQHLSADSAAIIMRFAGDCLLGAHYESAAGETPGIAFDGFDLFRSADIAVVNLENPVTTRGTRVPKPFNFRMHPRFLPPLRAAGVTVVSIANNHVFDYGREGLFDTFSYLEETGIAYVGAGRDAAHARRPYLFRKHGRSVGILAYYGGGEAPAATRRRPGVARRDRAVITEDVRALRKADSSAYVVVILHWGVEKASAPEPEQRRFAHALIDAGVDAVIGHHPHVLQGIERYKHGVIAYSLGNLLFGGNSRHTYDTGLFEIMLDHRGPSYRFIPVGVRQWRLVHLTGAAAEPVERRIRSLSHMFPSSIFPH